MDTLFIKLLNMSIAASWLILAVITLRVLLKKAPKWINCILWGLVAIRLVCPFSFESILSLIPSAETINADVIRYSEKPMIDSGVSIINHSINPFISENFAPAIGDSANPLYIWTYIAGIIWIAGLGCLLIYALISFLRLYRKVSEAVPLQDNVWQADTVKSPFILGIVSPKIYVSSSTGENQIDYILAHEQAHIKRKDHIWKLLGYLLLAVYWFNPLSWVAYILFCRDIELACDEKVICGYDEEEKVKYSNTLLWCSMQRKLVISCPLAFGEVAVKERVKSVMKYKKPAFWLLCVSVMVCVIVAVCFLTNPVTSNAESGEITYAVDETADYDADVNKADDVYNYHTELLAAYRSFGLTYNETEKEMYFNGKLVRYFIDGVDIENSKAVVYDFLNEKGVVDVHTIREATQNEDGSINPIGRLVGIEEDSKAEFDNRDITAQTGVQEAVAYGHTDGAGGSTFEEVFSKYKDYGITYVEAANASGAGNVYYNGQLVNKFSDVTPDGGTFSFQSREKGGINVRTVYGSDGKITGIEIS